MPIAYAVKNLDETVRAVSRSGGVFTLMSNAILEDGGVVYGCALTEDFAARHIRVASRNDIGILRGSKYIQSSLDDVWQSLPEDLKQGRPVLFSGTPCQVAAVRAFVSAKRLPSEKLVCVDVICHGVPSHLVWEKYLRYMERRFGGRVESACFRDKGRFGWAAHFESVTIKGKTHSTDLFKRLFYSHYPLRPSCFHCPYKRFNRVGDLTIGDFWGIDRAVPGFNDDKGVSLVLVSSARGEKLYRSIEHAAESVEVDPSKCLQPALKGNFSEPNGIDEFWSDFTAHDIDWLADKYAPGYRRSLMKARIKHLIREVGRR